MNLIKQWSKLGKQCCLLCATKTQKGLILEPGDKLCSLWDRAISKGTHADSVAIAIAFRLGYPLIIRERYKKYRRIMNNKKLNCHDYSRKARVQLRHV